jgi:hypothetical protein
MSAEPAHRLRIARDPVPSDIVQTFGLDQRERDIAVEQRGVGSSRLRRGRLSGICGRDGLRIAFAGYRRVEGEGAEPRRSSI